MTITEDEFDLPCTKIKCVEEDEFEVDKNARSAFLGMKYKLTIYEFE